MHPRRKVCMVFGVWYMVKGIGLPLYLQPGFTVVWVGHQPNHKSSIINHKRTLTTRKSSTQERLVLVLPLPDRSGCCTRRHLHRASKGRARVESSPVESTCSMEGKGRGAERGGLFIHSLHPPIGMHP